ncbi:MAG: efflux RND transporter permease subunit [Cellvibrionales bacterium]|nr:efflux RND transporter permease subunit [Cellvibrionales bacterium]
MSEQTRLNQPTQKQQRGLIAWFVHNPVAANLLMWLIIVAGLMSISTVRQEILPKQAKDSLSISVNYPGASPIEVEEGITLKLEEALKNITGIKKIDASSRYGSASVKIEIDESFDADKIVSQIKRAVDSITSFPSLAEKPVISQSLLSNLTIQLQLHGKNLNERSAKILANNIKEDLLAQTDAKKVDIWGEKPFEIAIEVDEEQLRKYKLTIEDIANKVRVESINLPSGGIDSHRGLIILRVEGQSYQQKDFENLTLVTAPDGSLIRLGDVAKINDGFVDYEAKSYFDGEYSIGIAVFAVGNQDISEIAEQAKAYAKQRQQTLPEGVSLTPWGDITFYLKHSLNMMTDNMLWGAFLVVFMLALFLNIRVVFWVVAGLPVCFLGTLFFMPMPMVNISINLVSIFGFILVLGIIVDDAIIIGESVDRSIKEQGFSNDAVINGVNNVFLPAFFGVLTTVVAFLPMILVEGPWSAMPSAIGFIVIFCLLFSLLESKLILPAHLSANHQGIFKVFSFSWHERFQQHNNKVLSRWVDNVYQPLLNKSLRHRYVTIAIFISLLLLTLGLIGSNLVRYILLPEDKSDYLKAELRMGHGTTDAIMEKNTQLIADSLYAAVKAYQNETGNMQPVIKHLFYYQPGKTSAEYTVELTRLEDRTMDSTQIIDAWRKQVGKINGATLLTFSEFQEQDTSSHQLYYKFSSRNGTELQAATAELANALAQYDGISNIANSAAGSRESYIMHLKPKAESLGITLADLSRQVHYAFYGAEAQRIQRDNEEIRVMVRLPKFKRSSMVDLLAMDIKTPSGDFIPLSALATLEQASLQSTLTRINFQSSAYVKARLDKTVLNPGSVNHKIKSEVIRDILKKYPSVGYAKNNNSDVKKLEADLMKYFLISLFVVFALLAIPLKSYFQPVIIMTAIPFGIVGAILGHWIMGYAVSMLSIFGMIALTGVVVNDSLILVVFINRAKEKGLSIFNAAMESGRQRFRAIFLTTITTFVGVVPMLIEDSSRAENIIPMAISLGFGILFATTITLILVPCCYLILADIQKLLGGQPEMVKQEG